MRSTNEQSNEGNKQMNERVQKRKEWTRSESHKLMNKWRYEGDEQMNERGQRVTVWTTVMNEQTKVKNELQQQKNEQTRANKQKSASEMRANKWRRKLMDYIDRSSPKSLNFKLIPASSLNKISDLN